MAFMRSISAVYEDGWLKPLQPLPLRDHQRVEITVTALDESRPRADPERVRQLHEKADEWLVRQPASTVREPKPLSPIEKERLDAEFDQLLAEIHDASAHDSEETIAALVDEAVAATRDLCD